METQVNTNPNMPLITQMPKPQEMVIVYPPYIGKEPVSTTCPNCKHQVQTRIDYSMGLGSWLLVGGLFFMCPCLVCVPCVI
jgi:hypothetical protein